MICNKCVKEKRGNPEDANNISVQHDKNVRFDDASSATKDRVGNLEHLGSGGSKSSPTRSSMSERSILDAICLLGL